MFIDVDDEKESDMGWLIGLMLGLIGTAGNVIVKICWRYHHINPETRKGLWIHRLGTVLVPMAATADTAAFGFAPQALCASTAGMAPVFNLLLAPKLLGETWSCQDLIAAGLVVIGCTGVSLTTSEADKDQPYAELMAMFSSQQFINFSIGMLLYFAALTAIIVAPLPPAVDPDGTFALCRKLSWGCLGGSVSGFLLFTSVGTRFLPLSTGCRKAGATEPCGDDDPWGQPKSWAIVVAPALTVAILGVWLLERALSRYSAIYVTPMYQSTFVLMGAISGVCSASRACATYTRAFAWKLARAPSRCTVLTTVPLLPPMRVCAVQNELAGASAGRIICFVASLLMLVLGGCCSLSERASEEALSPREKAAEEEDEEEGEQGEEVAAADEECAGSSGGGGGGERDDVEFDSLVPAAPPREESPEAAGATAQP
jgi:hypothetical protein